MGDGLVTLSEIAVALKSRKPIISLNSWNIARDHSCGNAAGGNYAGICAAGAKALGGYEATLSRSCKGLLGTVSMCPRSPELLDRTLSYF